MSRRGFSLIELLTTLVILGLLASMALPKYQQFRKRANATDIIASLTTIRAGAYQYYETATTWPATAASGTVPTGLGTYLPGGGVAIFRGTYHRMRWVIQNRGRPNQTQLIQAAITDGVICPAVFGMLGGTGNRALTGVCGANGGTVTLFVDR